MVSCSAPQVRHGLLQLVRSKGSDCHFYPRKSKGSQLPTHPLN